MRRPAPESDDHRDHDQSNSNPLDLNNLPDDHSTSSSSSNTRGGDEAGKVYECRFCALRFCKSQALGGHMNRHRQERETETLNRARQLVLNNDGGHILGYQYPVVGPPPATASGSGSYLSGGRDPFNHRPVVPPLPLYHHQQQQATNRLFSPGGGSTSPIGGAHHLPPPYLYPAASPPRTTTPLVRPPPNYPPQPSTQYSNNDYYIGHVLNAAPPPPTGQLGSMYTCIGAPVGAHRRLGSDGMSATDAAAAAAGSLMSTTNINNHNHHQDQDQDQDQEGQYGNANNGGLNWGGSRTYAA